MLALLVQLVLTLVVCGVIFWAISELLKLVPMPEPFGRIVHVLLVVILVLIVVFYAVVPLIEALGSVRLMRP